VKHADFVHALTGWSSGSGPKSKFWDLPGKKVLAFNYKFTRLATEKEQLMLKRVNTSPAKSHTPT